MSGSMDGGIDSSIALRAGQGVTPMQNPLDTASRLLQLKSIQNQQALFPGQQQLQQQAIQKGATDQVSQNKQAAYRAMLPLMAMTKGSINQDMVAHNLANSEKNGVITQGVIQDMANNPQGDGPGFDAWVRANVASQSQADAANALKTVVNAPGDTVNTGDWQFPTTVAPAGSPNAGLSTPTGQSYQSGLPPQVYNDGGAGRVLQHGLATGPAITNQLHPGQVGEIDQPALVAHDAAGHPIFMSPRQMGATPGGPPQPAPGRRFPDALFKTPPAGTLPGGGFTPPDSQTTAGAAAATTGADVGAKTFANYTAAVPVAQKANSLLDTVIAGNQTAPSGAPGLRWAQQRLAAFTGFDADKAAQIDTMDKAMAQLVNTSGAGSDARQNMVIAGSPHDSLTPGGLDLVSREMQGYNDYAIAAGKSAASYAKANSSDPNAANAFQANEIPKLNPQVFMFNRLTAPQKKTFLDNLPGNDDAKLKFQRDYLAAKHGNLL